MTLVFKYVTQDIWEVEFAGRVLGYVRYVNEAGYRFCPLVHDWGYFTIDWMREITNFCLEKTKQRDIITTRTAT